MINPLYFVAIVVLIALSAFFSASEMSFSSANRIRLENMAEDGVRGAKTALHIVEKFDDALSAILIGNNLVNIGMSSLGSVVAILIAGNEDWTWVSTVILTVLVIIFGETMPKIVAKKNANRLVLIFCYPIRLLTIVLKPVIWIVVGLINLIMKLFPKNGEDLDEEEAQQELQSIIETAEDEKVLDEDQSELVQAALEFGDVRVSEVMTARVDISALDVEDDWDEILESVENSTFSRLPVYEDSIDNIIGVLYLNHFLKALSDGDRVDIRKLLMPPCYVYKTMKLPAVLNQLRRAKQHLAVVTDEYGGTLGVLSMEDVLEQIVGDIWDETDTVEQEMVCRGEGEYELEGSMLLADFLDTLGINEDDFEAESSTVGGWTLEMFGGFPHVGDSFRHENMTVTVLSMVDGRRVGKVLVQIDPAEKEE